MKTAVVLRVSHFIVATLGQHSIYGRMPPQDSLSREDSTPAPFTRAAVRVVETERSISAGPALSGRSLTTVEHLISVRGMVVTLMRQIPSAPLTKAAELSITS